MKNIRQRSFIGKILPSKNLVLPELNSLLQLLPDPAILVEGTRHHILAVNLPFLKMTSFARNEVLERPVNSLFEGQPVSVLRNDLENAVSLKRSHRPAIPVTMRFHNLGGDSQTAIVTFSVIDEKESISVNESPRFLQMAGSVIEKSIPENLLYLLRMAEFCRVLFKKHYLFP